MRLVHLSDLHLGFRHYERLTPAGLNFREVDVAETFARAIGRTIELQPDVVLVAGDVFHAARPTNVAVVFAYQQFRRLRSALPDAAIVVIAGNHDTPKATESGSILPLLSGLKIHVATSRAERITVRAGALSVLAVPHAAVRQTDYTPDPGCRHNALLVHTGIQGIARHYDKEIGPETLGLDRWSYVALGDYHVMRQLAPNAFYSGSIDYTSSNPWGELAEERERGLPGKGILEYDLERGRIAFHHITPTRALVDLPPIDAMELSAADADVLIHTALSACPGGIDGKIVRLVVRCPRTLKSGLDRRALKAWNRRAFHVHVVYQTPEVEHVPGVAPRLRRSLSDLVDESLRKRPLEPGVDREALVALGQQYLVEAESNDRLTPEPVEPARMAS